MPLLVEGRTPLHEPPVAQIGHHPLRLSRRQDVRGKPYGCSFDAPPGVRGIGIAQTLIINTSSLGGAGVSSFDEAITSSLVM